MLNFCPINIWNIFSFSLQIFDSWVVSIQQSIEYLHTIQCIYFYYLVLMLLFLVFNFYSLFLYHSFSSDFSLSKTDFSGRLFCNIGLNFFLNYHTVVFFFSSVPLSFRFFFPVFSYYFGISDPFMLLLLKSVSWVGVEVWVALLTIHTSGSLKIQLSL